MTIDEIKNKLKKQATIYKTVLPGLASSTGESWIGKVAWQKPYETIPTDSKGNEMIPIATLFIDSSLYVPEDLSKVKLITIYMSEEIWDNMVNEDLSPYFEIRTYDNINDLVTCEYTSNKIKPLPLSVAKIDNDFPFWDDGGIPEDLFDTICEMEENNNINYFDDIFENNAATHKLGGYPSFCQSGYWFENGYDYVLQISSDTNAKFNIVDGGNFYFFYNPIKTDWKVYCDFF